jgi:tripartite-type tricarboxylate transporter receptor subunit TctC
MAGMRIRTARRSLVVALGALALRPALAADGAVEAVVNGAVAGAADGAAVDSPESTRQPTWPDRPIRLIVPFEPGGGADLIARLLDKGLARRLGQAVVIENRAGAGGAIGTQAVAQAAPDGYTLGIATQSTHAANPAINPRVPYDPLQDFTAISMLARVPGVLAVHPLLPVRTLAELIALARSRPRELSYGTPGVGSLGHLLIAQIEASQGLELLHVPYKGGPAALADTVGGRLQVLGDSLASALPQIRAGRLLPIAVMSDQRLPMLPDVPTFAESGMGHIGEPAWFGLVAPAGTPAAVIIKLNDAIKSVMHDPDVSAALARTGGVPAAGTPQAFSEAIGATLKAYRAVVAVRGIKPE